MTVTRRLYVLLLTIMLLVAVYFGMNHPMDPMLQSLDRGLVVHDDALQPVVPLRKPGSLRADRVALGRQLFSDARLSGDGTVSCSSCHRLEFGGTDNQSVSTGIQGAKGTVNAPTVLNSGFGFSQFWDGRASSLEVQASGPIHNPVEMGSNWAQVIERLGQDAAISKAFASAYSDGLSAANIANALATFERSLVTVDSRLDQYLLGDTRILTDDEIKGYKRFREYGCTSCHQGALLGGNMYQKFGVMGDYFAGKQVTKADLGRYNVTGREEDRHVFKVPTLRNVALTAPYFHDGSAETLEAAVKIMGRYQLGRELDDSDVNLIVAFLKTLSGPGLMKKVRE